MRVEKGHLASMVIAATRPQELEREQAIEEEGEGGDQKLNHICLRRDTLFDGLFALIGRWSGREEGREGDFDSAILPCPLHQHWLHQTILSS